MSQQSKIGTGERNGAVLREARGGTARTSARLPKPVRDNHVEEKNDIRGQWMAGSSEEMSVLRKEINGEPGTRYPGCA